MRRPAMLAACCLLLLVLGSPVGADELADMIARAEAGDMIDQADLAKAYYFGNGAPQDYKQAYIWYSVAADQGFDEAANRRDKCATKLEPADLEQAKAEAEALKKRLGQANP